MHNRVQLNLIIDDNDLYDNLVIPAKQERELHSLVTRLLSSYYYNEDVRVLVDGENDYVDEESSIMDAISELRNNLAMQTFLSSDLSQVLENGAEDIANIAKSGGTVEFNNNSKMEFSQNSAGNIKVKLITENQETVPTRDTMEVTESKGQEPDAMTLIKYMAKMLNLDLSGAYKECSSESKSNIQTQVEKETLSSGVEDEVVMSNSDSIEVFTTPVPVENNSIEEPEVKIEYTEESGGTESLVKEEVPKIDNDLDASDSIAELLGSI